MESRDPKDDATKNEIEMLVEMELQEGMRPNRLIGSIQRAGFKVTELNRTVNPLGAAEPSDPGSIGKILILIPFIRIIKQWYNELERSHNLDALSGAPWFPKSIHDLDICSRRVIMYGDGGLDADHPVNFVSFAAIRRNSNTFRGSKTKPTERGE